jgi:CubicO group peptidase (beta-lactamase class C family)
MTKEGTMKKYLVAAILVLLSTLPLHAQSPQPPLDAAASDPNKLGIMQGFPPPPDKTVRIADGSAWKFPQLRWSFSHERQLGPTVAVWRGTRRPSELPKAVRGDLDKVAFKTLDGKPMTWDQSLATNYTDGIIVLHKGRIVYERYFGALDAHRPHIIMSCTKSFVGTLAAILVQEGKLDPSAPVVRYVPEMKDSAFADATVKQVMDMTTGIQYSEKYSDPNAEIWLYIAAGGWFPVRPDYKGPRTLYDFLKSLKKEGEHGQAFAYKTPNAELLGWIVQRVSDKPLAQLLSETIWQKIGAEEDAAFAVDSVGTPIAGGGMLVTLRDFARVGEMLRLEGKYNGKQIVPKKVIDDIRKGGDKALFAKAAYGTLPGWSYHDMWWISNNDHGVYTMRGIHGQALWIDPKAKVVIARLASNPVAANAANDPISLPAYMAIAKELMKSK